MEEQLRKLKSKTIISLILALLALTWQFINYTTIKEYVSLDNFTSLETIIIYSSYLFLIILFLSIISLSFTVFRVSIKYGSEKKKLAKELNSDVPKNEDKTNTEQDKEI